ncbi:YraN family protein [Tessaracoccus sp. MC1627]|uniref:YraN family protein n=1 Tax=Tessaracoccus sp. MC1627 TaxID=2760312 RepID=UPI0016005F47|nr:YraN family protein [Tessaracoccus sp. MC1627]MBB1513741.1 YraN family protein [Tessaracoccus sp. MC1627]
METPTQALGRRGEDKAVEYVEARGWRVLERNWRCREGEIDIVAAEPDGKTLVVVEVKSRSGLGFGSPLETITYAKACRLRRLAALYVRQSGLRPKLIRVDGIGVLWPRGGECEFTYARGIDEW